MVRTTFVSADDLAAHLDDPSWLVLDCRHNLRDEPWGRAQYLEGHIPGAVFVSLAHDLAGARTGTNGRHPLPSDEELAVTFGRLGIGPGTQVIAYDQDAGPFASRLWWMLRYAGHNASAVLDGGWAAWLEAGQPSRPGEEHRPAATFVMHPRRDMLATIEDVERRLGDPAVLLVDSRSPERFEGQPDPLDNVPGHIPGARNRFYRDNVSADGTLRASDTLRAEFARVIDGRPADQVVMYCGSGVTACLNLLAMEHVGMRGAKLFVGSWSEWESDSKRPIERGPGSR